MSDRARSALVIAALAAAVALVYGRAAGFGFVELDDRSYVVDNPHVTSGLSATNVGWAITAFRQANWHPLTWISLQADATIGGGRPAAFHVTSLVLHALAASLLFLCLRRATGAAGRSFAASLLFAVHPLRVESVVWIAERKDVLSQALGFASLYAWTLWIEKPSPRRYATALGLFALGLTAKPMLVTLPVVMVLLDRWPFDRFDLRRSVREKLPFFALSAASAVVTVVAQSKGGAIGDLVTLPLSTRLANACVSAVDYLALTFWPHGLVTPFPLDTSRLTPLRVGASALVLAAITAVAFRAWRSRPHLAVGWAWFLVTLLPVIGVIQVGSQARADRYTYLPLVGIVVALVWEVAERLCARFGARSPAIAWSLLAAVAIPAAWATAVQVSFWSDGVTLFQRTVERTGPNAVARQALGLSLFRANRLDESIAELRQAVTISDRYPEAWTALGEVLLGSGRRAEAIEAYRRAVSLRVGDPAVAVKLVAALNAEAIQRMKAGDAAGAERMLREAVATAPGDATSHATLGVLLARTARLDDAEREFAEAVRLDPANAGYRSNLERLRGMRR